MPKMPEYLDKWVVNILLVGFSVAVPVALVVGPGFFERADGVSSRVPFHKESVLAADTRDDASWISLLLRLAHIERPAARAQSSRPNRASPKEVAPRLSFSFLESPRKPVSDSSSYIVRPARPIQPISAGKTSADEQAIAATRQSALRSIGTTVQVEPKAIKAPTPTAQTAKPSAAQKTVIRKTIAPRRVSSSQQIRPVLANAQPAATQPSQPLPALLDETQTASVMQTPIGRPRAERPETPSASAEDKPKAPASPPPASIPPKPTPPVQTPSAPTPPTQPSPTPPAPTPPRPEPIAPPAQPSPPVPVSPPIREPLPPIRPPDLPAPRVPVQPEVPELPAPSFPKPEEPKPPKNQEPKPPKVEDPKPPKAEDPKPPKKDDPKPPKDDPKPPKKDDPKPPKDGLIPRTAHDLLPISFK